MYTKDKEHRITIRLNDRQYAYLKGTADAYGITPSNWLRMIIDTVSTNKGVKFDENIEELRDSNI